MVHFGLMKEFMGSYDQMNIVTLQSLLEDMFGDDTAHIVLS